MRYLGGKSWLAKKFAPILQERRRGEGLNRRRVRLTRATTVHQVIEAEPGTLTLCFAGPVRGSWGFYTADGGYIDWKSHDRTGPPWVLA